MLRALSTVLFALATLFSPVGAVAETRHALVIGIDDYTTVPKLERAVADARAMARTLGELGFRVRLVENPDRSALSAAFAAFREGIEAGDTAFVFFAGHGLEIDGQNVLLPRDAPNPADASQDQVRDAGFLTASLIERVTRQGARAAFFVFDACRNNPYASRTRGRSIGSTRGLTRQEAPEGVFVLMSAGQGQEALDSLNVRGGPAADVNVNSVFTRVLIEELRRPGLTHIELAKSVQLRVRDLARRIDHPQLPAFYDQIVGNVVFRDAERAAASPPPTPPPPSAAAASPDEVAWSFIRDAGQRAQIEQFIARFPLSPRRAEAQAKLAELDSLASAAPLRPQPAPVAPSRAVDAAVLATECDSLAAAVNDLDRPSWIPGVTFANIDAVRATPACRRALAEHPQVARFAYQLARALDAGKQIGPALEAYELAARGNHRLAMNAIGVLYATGSGVPRDFAQAKRWWERAAALGDTPSMRNIGVLHRNGDLGARDVTEARRWWDRAAALNNTNAMNDLGELHLNGIGVAVDLVAARRWFEKAAELGDDGAIYNLALLYDNGRGVAQSFPEARRWYEKAAALGNGGAMNNLGVMYERGRGVARDLTEAWRWYERAAQAGDAQGMRNLGAALETGRGAQKDLDAARQWYERAAAAGNSDAKKRLELLRRRR